MTNEKVDHSTNSQKRINGIQFRFFLIFNSFFAFIMVYANKVVLSVAIVAMISETPISLNHNNLISTHHLANATSAALRRDNLLESATHLNQNLSKSFISNPEVEPKFKINQLHFQNAQDKHTYKSKVLGAFFWGYIVTQVPAGRLAERFGAKWLLGVSMLFCSLMSLIIPVATLSEQDFATSQSSAVKSIHLFMHGLLGDGWALQLLRIAQGVCAGVAHPCMHALITRWTPKNELSLTTAFIYSGSQIGTVFIMPLTGFLASNPIFDQTWESVFYLLGILGTVWFIFWCIFVYDTPDKHPFISKEELRKLKIGIGDDISHDNRDIPWGKVFSSLPVWALVFAHFGQNFGYFMLLTELPTYLKEALHYDIKSNGLISSLPYLVQAVTSWISSYISDRIVRSEKYPLSWVRKGFNSVGFFGPALCFAVIALVGGIRLVVILALIFSLGLNGFAMSGFHVTHVDLCPDFAGTLMGITNGISNFNGIIAPYIVKMLTNEEGETKWGAVFLIACAVYIITNSIYCWFGTSVMQPWARPADRQLVNEVYVCENSFANGNSKKDVHLLLDMKKSSINGSLKQDLKHELSSSNTQI